VLAGTAPLAVAITDDPDRALDGASVAIDFTLPAPSLQHARRCRAARCPGDRDDGHDEAARAELGRLAESIPIVLAPNMSLGVNLLFKLAELAARALDARYDVEIVEAHHRTRWTRRAARRSVSAGRSRRGGVRPRVGGGLCAPRCHGSPARRRDRIQRRSRRRDRRRSPRDLCGPGEQIELAHHARTGRASLAAPRRGRWVTGRPPGLYSMLDVLGL